MRTILLVALGVLLPCAASAQYNDPAEGENAPKMKGMVLSLEVGYSIPAGDAMEGGSMNDVMSGAFPLGLGLGYRVNPSFSAGLNFLYAPAMTKNCEPGNSCSASDMIFEGEMRLHLSPEANLSPWLSAVLGYEWLSLSDTGTDLTLKGFVFGIRAGGDYRLAPAFTLGPYLGLRFGTYDSAEASQGGRSGSGDIPSEYQTWHGWFLIGVRGSFTL